MAVVAEWDVLDGGERGAVIICAPCLGHGTVAGDLGPMTCQACSGDGRLHRPYSLPVPTPPQGDGPTPDPDPHGHLAHGDPAGDRCGICHPELTADEPIEHPLARMAVAYYRTDHGAPSRAGRIDVMQGGWDFAADQTVLVIPADAIESGAVAVLTNLAHHSLQALCSACLGRGQTPGTDGPDPQAPERCDACDGLGRRSIALGGERPTPDAKAEGEEDPDTPPKVTADDETREAILGHVAAGEYGDALKVLMTQVLRQGFGEAVRRMPDPTAPLNGCRPWCVVEGDPHDGPCVTPEGTVVCASCEGIGRIGRRAQLGCPRCGGRGIHGPTEGTAGTAAPSSEQGPRPDWWPAPASRTGTDLAGDARLNARLAAEHLADYAAWQAGGERALLTPAVRDGWALRIAAAQAHARLAEAIDSIQYEPTVELAPPVDTAAEQFTVSRLGPEIIEECRRRFEAGDVLGAQRLVLDGVDRAIRQAAAPSAAVDGALLPWPRALAYGWPIMWPGGEVAPIDAASRVMTTGRPMVRLRGRGNKLEVVLDVDEPVQRANEAALDEEPF
jgi:hypothetical protein